MQSHKSELMLCLCKDSSLFIIKYVNVNFILYTIKITFESTL